MASFTESLTYCVARRPYRVDRLTRKIFANVVPASVHRLFDYAEETAEQRLAAEEGQQIRFRRRLHARWGASLDSLKLFRLWSLQAGINFHERHKPAEGDWVYAVLLRLHARSCLIASEVIALLEAGLASGAHARWRSAHEIAVVGSFIANHGQEVAERYLLHEAVESHRAVADYQRYATRLDYEPFSDDELDEMRESRDALVARFGRGYGTPYGWAAGALNHPQPTFRDIEASVSLDHLRPYYRMASHPTHAGPKGIAFDLGLLRGDAALLAGPSNAGLADPGHAMALSLLHSTVTLLNHDPDMGDVVTMMFLLDASDTVGERFIAADRQLREDERRTVAPGEAG
jgi:hypothetical protein